MSLTFSRSFMLYFIEKNFFNTLKMTIIFDANRKLSIYIFTMLVSSFEYLIRILKPLFSYINLLHLKNTMTFWFQRLLDYLKLYKLFKSLYKRLFYIWKRWYISSGNFIKMSSLLSPSRLFKYTHIIST